MLQIAANVSSGTLYSRVPRDIVLSWFINEKLPVKPAVSNTAVMAMTEASGRIDAVLLIDT